jgi:hypothetical protein
VAILVGQGAMDASAEVAEMADLLTLEQARALGSALRHGDPDARAVLRESLRQKVADFVRRD